MRIRFFLLFFSFASLSMLHAQQTEGGRTVSGVVVDATGEPIIGASVSAVEDTSVGVITNIAGEFRFRITDNIKSLRISYVGHKSQTIEIAGTYHIRVVLLEDDNLLTEVVVVGYGQQKKESVTGAISTVSSEDIIKSPVGNISNALVGRVSGLTAVQQSGEPGFDKSSIRIRGVGTFAGDQNPLVVIDGIVQTMEMMNMIDPNEVENINVLKDASATAVYGVRGANGVIIITTKQGAKGKPQVSLTTNFGLVTPTSLAKLTNAYEYAVLRNEGILNDGLYQPSEMFSDDELWKFQHNRDYTSQEIDAMTFLSEAQKNALANSPALYYASHDYLREIFSRTAPQQQYNVNLSGGSDKVNYFVSVGYLNQEGLLNNFGIQGTAADSKNQRISFRNNFDFKFIKNTDITFSIAGYSTDLRTFTNDGGNIDMGSRYRDIVKNIYESPPFAGPGVLDGKLIGGYAGLRPANGAGGISPINFVLNKAMMDISANNLNVTLRGKHNMSYLLEGLSIRGAFSYESNFNKNVRTSSNTSSYNVMRNLQNPNEILFFEGRLFNKQISEEGFNKNYKLYYEGGIDYDRRFDKHTVTAMALLTAEKRIMPGLLYNIPMGMYGLVGRVTYSYDDRYLAEFNMGYNGSENFAPGKRFGFFPAVSLGWVVSNESFFPRNDFFTWLKIRGSYGQTGNSNIGGKRFMYLPGSWGAYDSYSAPFQGYYFGYTDGTYWPANRISGKFEQSVGNPNVTWEKKESVNLAIDAYFFRNRLTITADIFRENRNNILTTLEIIPGIIGMDESILPPENVGSMINKGYEINAAWRDNAGDFYYQIGGQLSYAKNKITYKAEPTFMYPWMNETGFSYGQYKGYYNEGFYNSAQEAANHPFNTDGGNNAQAGDLRIVDINGDGLIDDKDKIASGYSNIPRYAFSSNLMIGYKGFEISALFSGTAQGTFSMNGYLINPFTTGVGNTMRYIYNGRWTPERLAKGEEITYPRASVNMLNGTQNGINNSFWLRSTNHFKLKNIEVAYTFDKNSWIKNTGMTSLKIYTNANNLFTWKKKELIDGIDPELSQDKFTSEGAIYPLTRVVNFGLKIQF